MIQDALVRQGALGAGIAAFTIGLKVADFIASLGGGDGSSGDGVLHADVYVFFVQVLMLQELVGLKFLKKMELLDTYGI